MSAPNCPVPGPPKPGGWQCLDDAAGRAGKLGALSEDWSAAITVVGADAHRADGPAADDNRADPGMMCWFVLGYAFYSVVYAAVGSMASRMDDVQTAMGPLLAVLLGGYFLAFTPLPNPDGWMARVGSFLPLTAPLVCRFASPLPRQPSGRCPARSRADRRRRVDDHPPRRPPVLRRFRPQGAPARRVAGQRLSPPGSPLRLSSHLGHPRSRRQGARG